MPSSGRPRGRSLTGHTDTVFGVAFSPDGRTLASASEDRTVARTRQDLDRVLARIADHEPHLQLAA